MHSIHRLTVTLLIVAMAAATLGCSSSSPDTPQDESAELAESPGPDVKEKRARADAALESGEWQQAANHYQTVTDAEPDRWEAHMNRGIALARLQDYQKANDAFEAAIEAGGAEEGILYFNLGNLYQSWGLYEAAIDAYRASMAYGTESDYEALLNISACLTFLNAFDQARETIDRAIDLEPNDLRAKVTLGVIKFSKGDASDALDLYDEILAVDPDLARAHYNRAFVLQRMGEVEEARRAYETYLELDPDGPYVTQAETQLSTLED